MKEKEARKIEGLAICLIDYGLAGDFFIRMAKSDPSRHYVFISLLPSCHLKSIRAGYRSVLISRKECHQVNKFDSVENSFRQTREHLLEILPLKDINKLANRTYNTIREQTEGSHLTVTLLIWNGSTVLGEVARLAARRHGFYSLFFEISNLPGKIFIDDTGTNAYSRLFDQPELLDNFRSERISYESWLNDHLRKSRHRLAPQARFGRTLRLTHILDYIYQKSFGFQSFSKTSFWKKIHSLLELNSSNSEEKVDTPKPTFVFFPLQLEEDTQLLIHSDYSNASAIRHILETDKRAIVLKAHPAQHQLPVDVTELLKNPRIVLSSANTYDLVESSTKVYTINSSVGLEAMLRGIEVEFLGRTYYDKLTGDRLINYVQNLLVNVDFFSTSLFPEEIPKIYSFCGSDSYSSI